MLGLVPPPFCRSKRPPRYKSYFKAFHLGDVSSTADAMRMLHCAPSCAACYRAPVAQQSRCPTPK